MTRVSGIAEHGSGLCRKPPSLPLLQPVSVTAPDSACTVLSDSGGNGPGAVRRGIGAVISGMRTLNRNRQLLWFSALAGLVLAGNTVGQALIWYATYNLQVPPDRAAWQFFIEFATMFCMVFLLAGLVLSIPSKREGPAVFFEGLNKARKHQKELFLWSFVLALAGMLLVTAFTNPALWLTTTFGYLQSFLFDTLSHFPFNVSRLPPTDMFSEIPGFGGRSVLLWFYFGLREALIFSAVNLLLFVLTPFVVPHMVLGKKTIQNAVAGSLAMMKKAWIPLAACTTFLGIVVYGVFLAHLLVQGAHGMVTPLASYYRPTDIWIALGLFYDLALFSVAFVVITVGGIAMLDLYTSAKSGQAAGGFTELPCTRT